MSRIFLKYGVNPHQTHAVVTHPREPMKVLNGQPGYINLLDALTGWQLVAEMHAATGKVSAASFKHVSPAGAAIEKSLDDAFLASQFLPKRDYSPVASAYARARGGDRMCSFGDAVAVSDTVDFRETIAPFAGLVMDTLGGLSGLIVTVRVSDVLALPAVSIALAWSV